MPARLSSSLNQPPTPTKAAIAVREIVRSTAQKNRAGVTALPVSGRHARRFIRGRNRVSAVCTEAVPSFFPAAHCAAVSASSEGFGKDISGTRLEEIFLELQAQGAHNINLVTPTQYLPSLLPVLKRVKPQLFIPIVYNCGGYETLEAVDALAPYIDIWLPDLKYYSSELSARYSAAPDYFPVASAAVKRMIKHTGPLVLEDFSENGQACQLMKRGVILRHMVLPKHKDDSIRLLHWIHDNLPEGHFLVSLMSQYTPFYQSSRYPEINRRITSYEYQKVVDAAIELGLTQGFMQEKSSAKEEYTPPFELQGI